MKDYIDFEESFKQLIEKHKMDKDYQLIKDYPAIFSTIRGIARDRHCEGVTKMLMNTSIAYFVLPTDVISEKEFGIKGYLDDFFICVAALYELLEYDKNLGQFLISKYWKLDEDYERYIPNKYYALIQRLGEKATTDTIASSGLQSIKEQISLRKKPRTYSEHKIRELQRRLDYMFYLFFNRNFINREEKMKFDSQCFGTEEFIEFTKKIELLAESDNSFNLAKEQVNEMFDIEEEIRKARAKRLLG